MECPGCEDPEIMEALLLQIEDAEAIAEQAIIDRAVAKAAKMLAAKAEKLAAKPPKKRAKKAAPKKAPKKTAKQVKSLAIKTESKKSKKTPTAFQKLKVASKVKVKARPRRKQKAEVSELNVYAMTYKPVPRRVAPEGVRRSARNKPYDNNAVAQTPVVA
tara:strand:- start:442 stop:921 length:480 start_codon:yes stop_codon:yes gene_type:complete